MTTPQRGSGEPDQHEPDQHEQDQQDQDHDDSASGQVSEAGSSALNDETVAGGADSVPDTPDTSAGDDLPPGSA